MNTLSILGYVFAMCLAPVAPFIAVRWYRRIVSVVKALRVLSRERRTSESLYDTAEALAGDAHNWRGTIVSSTKTTAPDGYVLTEDWSLAVVPQNPPQNQGGPALWPMIIRELRESELDRLLAADMLARHEFGVAKYGVPLVASNGRDHLADAYQEALDGVVYLRAASVDQFNCTHTYAAYPEMMDVAMRIRALIVARDGK